MSKITFDYDGMEITCDYDKNDGSIIACQVKNCVDFQDKLNDYSAERLYEQMHEAIKARADGIKMDNELSNCDVNERLRNLGVGA